MPIYKFSCNGCGKVFDKILSSSDISSVTCSACNSPDIRRVLPEGSSATKGATSIPAGALSGGSCKSGFS
ncbi:zinc ribbon domain-containing protein [Desulfopila sp. IMCC35006]|uniref:FmdB family zinc ribbon protein n=1 Tax=Desulfopila sp. IMCC35006 TaxID=2569542 RepID=UPI0010AD0E80|nr:zinc ribbon domain-containing protein [Desulfopila sp. IMCC35006]